MIKLKDLIQEAPVFGKPDMDKVFMKGVGPGGEPNPDQLTDEPEKEIEDAFKDLDKEIKRADLEPKEVKEALGLTIAGVALSMPAIIKLIGKFANLLKRIPGLKKLSGDKIIALGDKWHHKLTNVIKMSIKKVGVKDDKQAFKAADIIFHVVIATLLIFGGIATTGFIASGALKAGLLKGAMTALKTGEVSSFVVRMLAGGATAVAAVP